MKVRAFEMLNLFKITWRKIITKVLHYEKKNTLKNLNIKYLMI